MCVCLQRWREQVDIACVIPGLTRHWRYCGGQHSHLKVLSHVTEALHHVILESRSVLADKALNICLWTTKSLFSIMNWVIRSRSEAAESISRPPRCLYLAQSSCTVTSRCPANIYCRCYCFVGPGMCWITQWFLKVYPCSIMSDFLSAVRPQWMTAAEFEDVTWRKSPFLLLWVWHYSTLNICSLVQKQLPDIHTGHQQVHPLSLKTRMSMAIICKSQTRRSDLGGSGTET